MLGALSPAVFEQIGKVVHWEGTPDSSEIAAVLDPRSEVRPGQFVGVWHGKRGHSVCSQSFRSRTAEMLTQTRNPCSGHSRTARPRRHTSEGTSTRIHRLMEGPTVERN